MRTLWEGLGTAGLILLCVLVFWPMFSNGFVWDDLVFIRDNAAIRGLWPPARFLDAPPGMGQRPLLMLSYALDFRLYGLQPWGYHLTNLLLHFLCVLGVVFLGKALFKNRPAALFAGALFAVHPGHAEAVISFLGRSDLLATAFLLWGFLAYLGSQKARGLIRGGLYGMSLAAFALACLSKDTAAVFPALLLLWNLIQGQLARGTRKKTLLGWLPFVLVLILYSVFRAATAGGLEDKVRWWGGGPVKNALLVFAAYGEYFCLSFLPGWLSPWYELEQLPGLNLWIGFGLSLALLTLVAFPLLLRRSSREAFMLGWFALGLSPVLLAWFFIGFGPRVWGVLPGTMIAERWLYLPSVAVCLAGAGGWRWLRDRRKPSFRWLWTGLGFIVLVLFGLRTFTWASAWKTQRALGQTILSRFPDSFLGHTVMGAGLAEEGNYNGAVDEYHRAIRLKPDLAWVHYNFAIMLQDMGRAKEAVQEYRAAIQIQSKNPSYHNNLGTILYQQGRLSESESELREAVRLAPEHVRARVNLGNVLDDLGRSAEAETEYREAIRRAPDFTGAYYNLALCLNRQGKKEEAAQALEDYLEHGGTNRIEVEAMIRTLRGW
jgi:Flp pilus assembly protein TadD